MADEQNTQTTQATEQTAALSGGGDPNTYTQRFAQKLLGDVNPDGIVPVSYTHLKGILYEK